MDFLKTLLAYVALTVAFSVQEGPLPQDVPTPTPLPPNVTASPIPNAPAATDVPTATPTASPIPELHNDNRTTEDAAYSPPGCSCGIRETRRRSRDAQHVCGVSAACGLDSGEYQQGYGHHS